MKKTIISTVILTAITSTNAFAANQWGFDITDPTSGNAMTVRGTPNGVYDLDKLQTDVDANKQAAADAAAKADAAKTTADNNKTDVDALKTSIANTARTQSQINSAINGKNQSQDSGIQANKAAITTLQTQSADYVTKTDLTNDQAKQDAALKADQQRQDTLHGQEVKFRQDGDAKLQTQIDTNKSDITGLRADVDQNQQSINGLITSTQTAQDAADKAQTTADDAGKQAGQNKSDIAALTQSTKQQLQLKVNQATYDAGQAKQDDALKQEADSRDQGDKTLYRDIQANKTAIGTKANQSDLDYTNAGLARVGVQTTQNKKAIDDNKAAIATNTAGLTRVGTQTTQNKKSIDDNAAAISTNTAAVTRVGVQTQQNQKAIDKNTAGLAAEITRATGAEQANKTAITAEESRAKTTEAAIQKGVDHNANDIHDLNNKLANDVFPRFKKVEDDVKANATAISDEATRAQTAEATKVDQTAFKADQDRQDAVVSSLSTTVGTNTSGLAAEVNRAKAAEATKVDSSTYDADQKAQDSKIDAADLKGDTALAGVQANKQSLVTLTTGVTNNTAALSTKVEKADFTNDQQRQDAALTTESSRAAGAE